MICKYFLPLHWWPFHSVGFPSFCFEVWCGSTYLCFWCHLRNHCKDQCHEAFSLCFVLGVLSFQVLHLNLESILSWFLCMVSDKGLISLFYMWISSFPNTICWKDYSFSIVYFLEKEMAMHTSILAWRILWTEDSGRLQSMGLQESDMT